MIRIESVPMLRAGLSRPQAKPNATMKHTIKRYSEAYAAVFGVPPTVTVEGGEWIRIQGQSARVKRTRLKELAEQLEYRAGSRG